MDGLAWMVLGSTSGEPGARASQAPFSVYKPRPDDFPYKVPVLLPPILGEKGPRLSMEILLRHREACRPQFP